MERKNTSFKLRHRTLKKIFSIVLVLAMVVTLLPVSGMRTAKAEEAAKVARVAGNFVDQLTGLDPAMASWSETADSGLMTDCGNGIFYKKMTFDALSENTDVEYKITFNGSWDGAIGNGGGNISSTIPAGSTSFTIICDSQNGVVCDSVRSYSDEDTVSLIGTVRTEDTWEPSNTDYDFMKLSGSLYIYVGTYAAGSYEYKVVFNHSDWMDGGNRNLEVAESDTTVVFVYDTVSGNLYDSIQNSEDIGNLLSGDGGDEGVVPDVPAPVVEGTSVTFFYKPNRDVTSIILAGDFTDPTWGDSTTELTDEDGDGTYEVTLELSTGSHEYKFIIDGAWESGDNRTVVIAEEISGEIVSDSYVTNLVELQAGDQTVPMTLYTNGAYEAALELASGTYETKVLVDHESAVEGSVTVAADGTVLFRYQDRVGEDPALINSIENPELNNTLTWIGSLDALPLENPIASWDVEGTNGNLSYIGGGLYGRTFTFTAPLASETDIAYKAVCNHNWDDGSYGNDGENIEITVPAGTESITVLVDTVKGVVYDSVRAGTVSIQQNSGAVSLKPFDMTVTLIGDIRGGNDDWVLESELPEFDFTQISDVFFLYQNTYAKGTYNYKCVFDHAYWYEKEDGNQTIEITEDNTRVVILYDASTGLLYDSVNDEGILSAKLLMTARPAAGKVIDNKDGTTKFQMVAEAGKELTLYYAHKADSDLVWKEAAMTEEQSGVYVSDNIFLGDAALDIVYYYDIDGERVLDESNPTVTIGDGAYSNYTRAAFTGRDVYVPGTFPGPSWDAASNKMTYQGEGLYAYTFANTPAANYEFKIAMGSWSENYGDGGAFDGANMKVAVPKTMDVTVYYSDFSHRAVTSVDYEFADVTLIGTNIPEGVKLTDLGLTGIYSASVSLEVGTYSDVKLVSNGTEYAFAEFTLEEAKVVSFFFDPSTELYYNNASNEAVETEHIYYNSKDAAYKSPFGAVATGETVTFTLDTGADATEVFLIVKGPEKKKAAMTKNGTLSNGVQKWNVEVSVNTIGEYHYFFAIYSGNAITIYGDDDGNYGEGICSDLTGILAYDMIVYKSGYQTPDWMKNAVVYQIFPERFFDGDASNNQAQISARGSENYEFIRDWYTLPENPEQEELLTEEQYKATGAWWGDRSWSNEIYGGDIKGITEKIDYLKALGVSVIYLNPVFASISSHRYDTSDYMMIDPILGDLGDFTELVEIAEANDMHIVLDGVFNHVSDDSIYFDRYYEYLEAGTNKIGAYPYWAFVYDYMAENNASQADAENAAKEYFTANYNITNYDYVEWFDVFNETMKDGENDVTDSTGLRAGKPVYRYDGWWGYDSMPIIKSTNGSEYQTGTWAQEIIGNSNHNSVTEYWISKGNNGWRLDVANEVSDETWQHFRDSVKSLDSDAVIIGEIWTDATEYLLGDMYDSVMNYMFRNAVTSFAKGGDSSASMETLERLRERYPKEAFYAMMNLVSSHDTTRILSYLDGIDDDRNQKDIDSAFPTYEKTSDLAKKRQYLVAFLQFTYAGAPTIYYGDEIGMVGADDPDDRRTFEWGKGNKELVTWYATLANIRNNYPVLRTGTVEPMDVGNENILAYVRRDSSVADTSSAAMIVLANNAQTDTVVEFSLTDIAVNAAALTDLISGNAVTISNGVVTVTVPALSGVILSSDVKNITLNSEALAQAYDAKYIIGKTAMNPMISVVNGEYQPVIDEIKKAEDGAEIVVILQNDKVVKPEVLEAMAGKNVTVKFVVSVFATWIINGLDIPQGVIKDGIDLTVILYTKNIPEDQVQAFAKDYKVMPFTLKHNGAFGFKVQLSVRAGEEYTGQYANLYYYNETTKEFEYSQAVIVGKDGRMLFTFEHASEYLVVFSDKDLKPVDDSQDPVESQTPEDSQTTEDTQKPEDSQTTEDTQKPGDSQAAGDTQKPGDSQTTGDTQQPVANTEANTSTKPSSTGDHAPIAIWLLIAIAGMSIAGYAGKKKFLR